METTHLTADDLPATLSITQAADLLGISRSSAYRALEAYLGGDTDAWPCQVLRIGHRHRIPTRPLLAALGLGTED